MAARTKAGRAPSVERVRGTRDILADDMRRHRAVEEAAWATARRYGFTEIATPVFEFTEVFARTLGETSDIVTKEMYTFDDRSGDSVTLRPEFTAGVARAFISNGLRQQVPLKFFCRGPMFRYERPQKGRLRQFHQVDVEILGVAEPLADVEVIALGADFLAGLDLADKVKLELNTLGDAETRKAYRTKLLAYFADHRGKLSGDSLNRIESNPLRVLDSKDEGDREIVARAPRITDGLNDASKRYFDALLDGLHVAGVAYEINPRLVRGLDYYCHAAFEFTTQALGAQGTVLAGGRYDGLIEMMGGTPTPGTGWAAGVERLAMLIAETEPEVRPIAVVPVGAALEGPVLELAQRLRRAGFTVDMGYSGTLAKRMRRADRIGAAAAVIIGEDEIDRDAATVRDMASGEQREIALASLEHHLERYRGKADGR
ncbi:MAG: histidine--tRNA ligase [Rhodospirillales bacterium]|jgi:histidyl-tRNA synthetase|nr:histidine--tRNA ligase [Rhodospirillales bacterium]MDP6804498.1 histidine--tRNA ligase [Rhodospirillales bacterium]